jgi:D-alanyl-D-alanine carboxypeptidase/D-alanyl-D-alanine-endopeptidase (penicillin-binding protein 4)
MSWRRILPASLLSWALLSPVALAGEAASLRDSLSEAMGSAGDSSGAFVRDLTAREKLYSKRGDERRVLASNAKLFTTAATLAGFGPEERVRTAALSEGSPSADGVVQGDLYLRGGGDPTFGSWFPRRVGSEARVGKLARRVADDGVRRVRGGVVGDESLYDSLRGGPASGYATSIHVGPLSALTFNQGQRGEKGSAFQSNPPEFAAKRFAHELEDRGVSLRDDPRVGATPAEAERLASVESPRMAQLVLLTNKSSRNLFAELLTKALGVRARGEGSTAAGSKAVIDYSRTLGADPRLVDGSGLSRDNTASPRDTVQLLRRQAKAAHDQDFFDSLPIAGVDGTIADRMRDDPAEGRCSAKTGTLPGVSTLSGYCESRSGHRLAFSYLMNDVDTSRARELQDRMANALARYRG